MVGRELQRGSGGGFILIEAGVFGDADHGEDFLEVRGESEDGDFATGFVGFHEHLDDEGDTAGVDVVNFGEVEEHGAAVDGLPGADDGVL